MKEGRKEGGGEGVKKGRRRKEKEGRKDVREEGMKEGRRRKEGRKEGFNKRWT